MKPVQGMKMWRRLDRLPVLPPPSRSNKGRPHDRARRKSPHESSSNPNKLTRHGRVGTCSNCKKEGHNKTRCPNPTASPPPKRPRGRPKKNQVWFQLFSLVVCCLICDCVDRDLIIYLGSVTSNRSFSSWIITSRSFSIITRRIWFLFLITCVVSLLCFIESCQTDVLLACSCFFWIIIGSSQSSLVFMFLLDYHRFYFFLLWSLFFRQKNMKLCIDFSVFMT